MGFSNTRPAFELGIALGGAATSLALSVVHILLDPLLNPDGVVYLSTAEAWLDAGYTAAVASFPLPLYSILIAIVHTLSGLSLLASAHVLDALLIALIVVAMQRLVWCVGGGARAQLIAVALVLLLPELNGFRGFLLRNFGYWALWLLALASLVRYSTAPTFVGAASFSLLCAASAAFRLDAILFLVLLPVVLLFGQYRSVRATALLYVPVALGVLMIAAIGAIWRGNLALGDSLEPAIRMAGDQIAAVPSMIRSQLEGFGTHVLNPDFHDYAGFGLAGGLVTMILVHVSIAASLPLMAVACVGTARRAMGALDRRALPILAAALAIVLLELAAVLVSRGLIQTRYAMPAGFIVVLISAFVIDHWFEHAVTGIDRKKLRWAIGLGLAYFVGEAGFALFNSKQHYLEAVDWLEENTSPGARVWSNEPRVVYMANRRFEPRDSNLPGALPDLGALIERCDFIAVHVGRKNESLRLRLGDEPRLQRVAVFENRKHDALVIYTRREPEAARRTGEGG